jgi:chromosome segregation ATPase
MNEEIGRVQSSLLDIQSTLEILDGEIDGLHDEFERTQPIMREDASESLNLRQRAQELKEQIEALEDQVSFLQGQREELNSATKALKEELENLRDCYGHKRDEL